MIAIKLPDGKILEVAEAVTGFELAEKISSGLAKKALAIKLDGKLKDLATKIEKNAEVTIVTAEDDDGLEILRHSCSHIMAEAVKELYQDVQVTIGPAIDNGFYYDFAKKEPFSSDDLTKIEAKMTEIVRRNEKITREEWDRDEAVKFFLEKGENYKAEIIKDLPAGETISLYRQGDFIDLCRGPHVPSTGKIGDGFKLMKVAGAYWRGNSDNEMLQRIYGTCWQDKKRLKQYLTILEEAEKRDHRRLGQEMDLFHFEQYAPGDVFWHHKGWTLFCTLIEYMRKRQLAAGYIEVNTPQIMDRTLWETSGHWDWYRENMFTTEIEERVFAVKPMNCPGGLLIYKQGIKSYRDLPLYIAEFGKVHRYEPSGALHGLMRVRAFTQDDAHIFCTEKQLEEECQKVITLMLDIYKDFGLGDVAIKLSTRPAERIGDDSLWDKLENALADSLTHLGYKYTINEGDGAFYGPKLDFKVKDALGREWQLGTLQADLNLPERFDISYVGEDGAKHRPVMLHRALFGSLERFIGTMIEFYAGKFPLWLSPVQAVVTTITNNVDDYAYEVRDILKKQGLRVDIDVRNEKVGYKIREHSKAKVPLILVVGNKEAEDRTVALRRLGGDNQEIIALDKIVEILKNESKMPSID
ncbi:MAG: threonine--tRNA ligase [Alphaproteobacteria bacterium]